MSRVSFQQVTTVAKQDFSLSAVDFTCGAGEVIGVLGMNGAGKSTLLRALIGLEPISAGMITIDGEPIERLGRRERAQRIGYLPQQAAARWSLRVVDAVALGRRPHSGWQHILSQTDLGAIESAMREADVWHLRERFIDRLSGGEQMRVHLARLFAGQHDVLAADEPCASLDLHHQLEIMDLFRTKARAGIAVLTVLHDIGLAQHHCDRLIVLQRGRIALDDSVDQVMSDPRLADLLQVSFSPLSHAGGTVYLASLTRNSD